MEVTSDDEIVLESNEFLRTVGSLVNGRFELEDYLATMIRPVSARGEDGPTGVASVITDERNGSMHVYRYSVTEDAFQVKYFRGEKDFTDPEEFSSSIDEDTTVGKLASEVFEYIDTQIDG